MIVTIDGPAGAGKSSAARQLAERLGFEFLDTGAMYRAVAVAVMQKGIDPARTERVAKLMTSLTLQLQGQRLLIGGQDVTDQIRDPAVSQNASIVAAIPVVRARLVEWQRAIVNNGHFVCEGRDQGTVAFPHAECKIFLTADPEIRAQRRWEELRDAGEDVELEQVIAEQKIRDLRDETRAVGRLQKAHDAMVVRVDHQTLAEVVDRLEQIAKQVLYGRET